MNCVNQCNVARGGSIPQGTGMYPGMAPTDCASPCGSMGFAGYPMGYSTGSGPVAVFGGGESGCGGSSIPCAPYGWDVPQQARERKPRPPSSMIPARKIGVDHVSCTTLAPPHTTHLIADGTDDGPQDPDGTPDNERFDVFTLAFGVKPGSTKPARMLVTLKTPKVLAARLNTSTVATQVGYLDLGLSDPNKTISEHPRGSMRSKKSKKSKKSAAKSAKSSKGHKNKKSKK